MTPPAEAPTSPASLAPPAAAALPAVDVAEAAAAAIMAAEHAPVPADALPEGSVLDKYRIERALSGDGFVITYLATDLEQQQLVLLEEFLPSSLALRGEAARVVHRSPDAAAAFDEGLRAFVDEAMQLAGCRHPALLRVNRSWRANGTAYRELAYAAGTRLRVLRESMDSPPDEASLIGLLDGLTGALQTLHAAGGLHLDISPDSIVLLAETDRPMLIGFNAARRAVVDGRTQALMGLMQPIFVPPEQIDRQDRRLGPWSDLYSLAAVVRYCLEGRSFVGTGGSTAMLPPLSSALARLRERHPGLEYSPAFLAAMESSMAPRPEDRPRSAAALRRILGLDLDLSTEQASEWPLAPLPAKEPAPARRARPAAAPVSISVSVPPAPSAAVSAPIPLSPVAPPSVRAPVAAPPVVRPPAQPSVQPSVQPPARAEDSRPARVAPPVGAPTAVPGSRSALPASRPAPPTPTAGAASAPIASGIDPQLIGSIPGPAADDRTPEPPLAPPPAGPRAPVITGPLAFDPPRPEDEALLAQIRADLDLAMGVQPGMDTAGADEAPLYQPPRRGGRLTQVLGGLMLVGVLGYAGWVLYQERETAGILQDLARPAGAPAGDEAATPVRPSTTQSAEAALAAAEAALAGARSLPPAEALPTPPVTGPAPAPAPTVPPVAAIQRTPEPARVPSPAPAPAPVVPSPPPPAPRAEAAVRPPPPAAPAPRPAPAPPAPARAEPAAPRDAERNTAAAPNTPRDACSPRTQFALYRCMQTLCEANRWYAHPQCVILRQTDEVP